MGKYFVGYITAKSLDGLTRVQARKLTHLNIAFAPMVGDITVLDLSEQQQEYLAEIRSFNPELKILISTGGGDNHGHGEATRTPEGLKKLVDSTMDIVNRYDLDGIDCDWEFPGDNGIIEEKYQHTALLKAYREELDKLGASNGRKYWLTTAAAAGQWYLDRTEIHKSHVYLDFINMMTYDLRGWDNPAGHHTCLYEPENAPVVHSVDTDVKLMTDAGVPIEKILVGVAFYSRRWDHIANINNGLNQPSPYSGGFGPDYTEIVLKYEKNKEYVKHWDDVAKAAYLFNGKTLISYDDPLSIQYKCAYVKEKNMAGAFYWVHSADHTGILFDAMYDHLLLGEE